MREQPLYDMSDYPDERIPPMSEHDDDEEEDICGLCGEPGADKIAHPCHWPGERVPNGRFVHAACEEEECRRAHSMLSDKQRQDVLRSV